MSAAAMLAAARRDLGLAGRPNRVTRSYSARHGAGFLSAPWCQMAVTAWARASGTTAAVLPKGDRAYTVYHARDGEQLGLWHRGTVANIKRYARPGGIVYFDWRFTDEIAAIDHVGVIEEVLPDGRIVTIEGNTGDACKRRVRSASVIAGFWVPDYADPQPERNWTEIIVDALPTLNPGQEHRHVKTMRSLLHARGYPPADLWSFVYGKDAEDLADLRRQIDTFKSRHGLAEDGIWGKGCWQAALE